jgi:hypothetical protein
MLGIYIYILLALPVLIGLRLSLRDRHSDRRHFISFVGFIAALVAVAAAAAGEEMNMRLGVQSYYSISSAWKVLLAISGLSEVSGCVVAFVAGLFSTGRRRIFLIALAAFLPFLLFFTGLGRQGT